MSTIKANTIAPYHDTTVTIDSGITFNGVIDSSSGGFKFPDNTIQATASTSPNAGSLCTAWVACGEAGDHAPTTIKGSYNVSSVTEASTCNFYVNFATAMANNDYSAHAKSTRDGNYTDMNVKCTIGPKTTTQLTLRSGAGGWHTGCYGAGTLNVVVIGF